ncbi:MAG: SDR family NAD(P)-dependent oxidoreductase, partial [Acidimicrobiia bacterium]|nr:SDR family NAD(P)-dependent oxidoreductase [Acidimicrobiia bacterium]
MTAGNPAADLDFARLLPKKVAIVTGAASGQGRAAALLFGAHGARVVVADINDDGAAETIGMLEERGAEGFAIHSDVSVRTDVDAMVAAAMER